MKFIIVYLKIKTWSFAYPLISKFAHDDSNLEEQGHPAWQVHN